MTIKNDLICPHAKCKADLKEVGVTLSESKYRIVGFQKDDPQYNNSILTKRDIYCRACKGKVADSKLMELLSKGWNW